MMLSSPFLTLPSLVSTFPSIDLGDLCVLERSFTPHSSGVASLSLFGLELSGNVPVRPSKNGADHLQPTYWRKGPDRLLWKVVEV